MNYLLSGDKVSGLRRRSEKAFDVFHKTLRKLSAVNTQIETEQEKLRNEILERENIHQELEDQKTYNLKFSDKLKQLFHD